MTMITPSYLGETIEYSSLHACRSTLEDPTHALQQAHRPQIDVLLKAPANGNQQAPERHVVGHAGVAHRAEKNRVVRPKLRESVFRHHPSRLDVGFAAPVELPPRNGKPEAPRGRFDHANAFRNYFVADAIAGNCCNLVRSIFHVAHDFKARVRGIFNVPCGRSTRHYNEVEPTSQFGFSDGPRSKVAGPPGPWLFSRFFWRVLCAKILRFILRLRQ